MSLFDYQPNTDSHARCVKCLTTKNKAQLKARTDGQHECLKPCQKSQPTAAQQKTGSLFG